MIPKAALWNRGKGENILFPIRQSAFTGRPPSEGIARNASRVANDPWLLTTSFGGPVDPDVCKVMNGSDRASSKLLEYGYGLTSVSMGLRNQSSAGIVAFFIDLAAIKLSTMGMRLSGATIVWQSAAVSREE